MPKFKVKFLEEARDFISKLSQPVRNKIFFNIDKVAGGFMDSELFKKLEGTNIWEFRTSFNGQAYRLFAFWDTEAEAMVVATHGILKKTQKTPQKEISHAENIREIYFNNKSK